LRPHRNIRIGGYVSAIVGVLVAPDGVIIAGYRDDILRADRGDGNVVAQDETRLGGGDLAGGGAIELMEAAELKALLSSMGPAVPHIREAEDPDTPSKARHEVETRTPRTTTWTLTAPRAH